AVCEVYSIYPNNHRDTLISQAYGAKNYRVVRVVLQRAIFIAICLCIPLCVVFIFCEPMYRMLTDEKEPRVAQFASLFTYLLLPGIIPFVLYRIFSSYMVCQNKVNYPMTIGVFANIINILLNLLLVSGIGYKSLGFTGAAIGTSISRYSLLFMCFVALYIISKKRVENSVSEVQTENDSFFSFEKIKSTFKEILQWRGMKEFISLAIPAVLMFVFEAWGFQANVLMAAKKGDKIQSAHYIVSQLTVLSFMIPLALSSATSVRVGQRLGGDDPSGARFVCYLGISSSVIVTVINGAIMIALRSLVTYIFIDDDFVKEEAEKIIPVAAVYVITDGMQAVMSGILRGLGRQRIGAVACFVSYYAIGIPSSLLLTFYFDWGLMGIWVGMAFGVTAVSLVMLPYIIFGIDWNLESVNAKKRIAASDVIVSKVEEDEGHEMLENVDEYFTRLEDEVTTPEQDEVQNVEEQEK
ncbi:hypothetical protein AKO1_009544, partial [Acrasis kona]